jgi:hypothetical protein
MKKLSISLALSVSLSQSVAAGVCDYRPSHSIGGAAATAVAGGAGATAIAGGGLKAAGIYTLTNATTGAAMLGSTAVGASAAGTTGIIAGSAGFVGTAGAMLMSPFVLVPATIVAAGLGVYEGGCYLSNKPSPRGHSASPPQIP